MAPEIGTMVPGKASRAEILLSCTWRNRLPEEEAVSPLRKEVCEQRVAARGVCSRSGRKVRGTSSRSDCLRDLTQGSDRP